MVGPTPWDADASLAEEGLAPEDLEGLDWNPEDGGSFERMLARLTLDTNGVRGDEEGFDPTSIARYGLAADATIDYTGQTSWSPFAFSTGWTFTDAETWGTNFSYADDRFVATMDWYFGLVDKGFFPPFGTFGDSSPAQTQLQSGASALATVGSWMITTVSNLEGMELGIADLPAGPIGTPMSMFNGLGDSISSQSQRKEEAARLIAFLASDEAQRTIGERAPFFPATDAGTEAAIEAYAAKGLDVTPFTDRVASGETGLYPLVENSAEISTIMQAAFDQCWMRRIDGADFAAYNERVNALFT